MEAARLSAQLLASQLCNPIALLTLSAAAQEGMGEKSRCETMFSKQ
jgi:hypothetical protein